MEIKITIDKNIKNYTYNVRIDLYKTHEHFLHAADYDSSGYHCCTEVPCHYQNWEEIIDTIEINTNACLRLMELDNEAK